MDIFIKFLLLGLAAGAAYSLLGIGVVLVHRGSGIVNFAHGAVGLVGVAFFYELRPHVNIVLAIVIGVLVSAVLGVLIQVLVMRPLRNASPLMRVVATLATLGLIQQGAQIRYGAYSLLVKPFLPADPVHVSDTIIIGWDRFINFGIAIALTALLWALYRWTKFGLATAAAAENERAAASFGLSA